MKYVGLKGVMYIIVDALIAGQGWVAESSLGLAVDEARAECSLKT